jgi:bifunctional DNA-binding transcriptional regulator/antitoxin component of YhaV-PrlF toxin-antitoxin module
MPATRDFQPNKWFNIKQKAAFDFNCFMSIMLMMTQTKISKAFQTTISAEAIRLLRLRPGQRVNQIVEGKRLIFELVEDVDALAGSLGKGKKPHTLEEIKAAGRKGITKAGAAGLEEAV